MATVPRTTPPRLAIVDDDPEFRDLVRRIAEPMGWETAEFGSGRNLVAGFSQSVAPDLILLDLVMPELDGIETIGWIAATSIRCPIILITGTLPLYADIARNLGQVKGLEISEIVQKPVSLKKLREVLDPQRLRDRA